MAFKNRRLEKLSYDYQLGSGKGILKKFIESLFLKTDIQF